MFVLPMSTASSMRGSYVRRRGPLATSRSGARRPSGGERRDRRAIDRVRGRPAGPRLVGEAQVRGDVDVIVDDRAPDPSPLEDATPRWSPGTRPRSGSTRSVPAATSMSAVGRSCTGMPIEPAMRSASRSSSSRTSSTTMSSPRRSSAARSRKVAQRSIDSLGADRPAGHRRQVGRDARAADVVDADPPELALGRRGLAGARGDRASPRPRSTPPTRTTWPARRDRRRAGCPRRARPRSRSAAARRGSRSTASPGRRPAARREPAPAGARGSRGSGTRRSAGP